MTQIYLCELEESDFSDEYVSWHSSEHTAFYSGSNRIFTKDNLLEEFRRGKDQNNICYELDSCDGNVKTSLWNEYIATPIEVLDVKSV